MNPGLTPGFIHSIELGENNGIYNLLEVDIIYKNHSREHKNDTYQSNISKERVIKQLNDI